MYSRQAQRDAILERRCRNGHLLAVAPDLLRWGEAASLGGEPLHRVVACRQKQREVARPVAVKIDRAGALWSAHGV